MPRRTDVMDNIQQGNDGHRFFISHTNELLRSKVVTYVDVSGERVVNADGAIILLTLGKPHEHSDPEEMGEDRIRSATATEITAIRRGYAEIKTIWNYLFRSNDGPDPSGTLGFELWAKDGDGDGWLPACMNPARYYFKRRSKPKAVQPLILVFILMAYDMPFASIAFEDAPALFARLKEIGKELGIDPEHPSRDADTYGPDLLIIDNMWHVPMSRIADLATVTLIGDMPVLRPDIQAPDGSVVCSRELQQGRYQYLSTRAGTRKIPQDKRFADAFTLNDEQQAYANAAYNLAVLQSLDEERYPTLAFCQRNHRFRDVFKKLTAILTCMLATAKPRQGRFFLLSHDFLIAWCRDHGVGASKRSMQGTIKFLEDCGLLTVSKEPNRHGRPTTLLAADRYDEAVLKRAEETAKVYVDRKVSIARLTNTSIIGVRGADVAHALYHDERVVPYKQAYAQQLVQREVLKQIDERGYALTDEVFDRAGDTMVAEKNFVFIDPFKDFTPEEDRELDRQAEYRQALRKVKEQMRLLLDTIDCEWHQTTKAEKERYGFPKDWRRWIIVKKSN